MCPHTVPQTSKKGVPNIHSQWGAFHNRGTQAKYSCLRLQVGACKSALRFHIGELRRSNLPHRELHGISIHFRPPYVKSSALFHECAAVVTARAVLINVANYYFTGAGKGSERPQSHLSPLALFGRTSFSAVRTLPVKRDVRREGHT